MFTFPLMANDQASTLRRELFACYSKSKDSLYFEKRLETRSESVSLALTCATPVLRAKFEAAIDQHIKALNKGGGAPLLLINVNEPGDLLVYGQILKGREGRPVYLVMLSSDIGIGLDGEAIKKQAQGVLKEFQRMAAKYAMSCNFLTEDRLGHIHAVSLSVISEVLPAVVGVFDKAEPVRFFDNVLAAIVKAESLGLSSSSSPAKSPAVGASASALTPPKSPSFSTSILSALGGIFSPPPSGAASSAPSPVEGLTKPASPFNEFFSWFGGGPTYQQLVSQPFKQKRIEIESAASEVSQFEKHSEHGPYFSFRRHSSLVHINGVNFLEVFQERNPESEPINDRSAEKTIGVLNYIGSSPRLIRSLGVYPECFEHESVNSLNNKVLCIEPPAQYQLVQRLLSATIEERDGVIHGRATNITFGIIDTKTENFYRLNIQATACFQFVPSDISTESSSKKGDKWLHTHTEWVAQDRELEKVENLKSILTCTSAAQAENNNKEFRWGILLMLTHALSGDPLRVASPERFKIRAINFAAKVFEYYLRSYKLSGGENASLMAQYFYERVFNPAGRLDFNKLGEGFDSLFAGDYKENLGQRLRTRIENLKGGVETREDLLARRPSPSPSTGSGAVVRSLSATFDSARGGAAKPKTPS